MTEMEELFVPYNAEKRIGGECVLVFAPHPDDEVFGCGGAIMRHVMDNNKVRVVVVTDGGYPVTDSVEPQDYREIRRQESISAAKILGYGTPEFWDLPDRGIQYGEVLVQRMVEEIIAANADTVYAPSVYEAHPDHRAVAMSAVEAVRRLKDRCVLVMYEVGTPLPPNKLLDITDLIEDKTAAIRCFKSQLEIRDYARHMESLDIFRTYTLSDEVKAAEAYRMLSSEDLADPLYALASAAFDPDKAMRFPSSDDTPRPLVSILIRSIGRTEIGKALRSVALQTYPVIEVVVVNAKGEGHPSVDNRCGRFPVRFIDSRQPIRRSAAANIGLENARGDYLMFLDDDDWFDADHVSSLVKVLEKRKKIKLAYAGVRGVGQKNGKPKMIFNEPYDPIRLLARNYIPLHAALFSRTLLDKGCRFDEAFDIYEDWDFWLQLSQYTRFYHIDKITASYRAAPGSGFGVTGEPEKIREGAVQLYQKWRSLWTQNQLCGLMSYIQKLGNQAVSSGGGDAEE